jgi:hypothetical protein
MFYSRLEILDSDTFLKIMLLLKVAYNRGLRRSFVVDNTMMKVLCISNNKCKTVFERVER